MCMEGMDLVEVLANNTSLSCVAAGVVTLLFLIVGSVLLGISTL
jgi:hypothetical protein